MKILVQWATDPANGWVELDSRDWGGLSFHGPPPVDRVPNFDFRGNVTGFSGPPVSLDQTGWVNRVAVFGSVFALDHVSMKHHTQDGCLDVTSWSDDGIGQVYRCYPEIVEVVTEFRPGEFMKSYGLKQQVLHFQDGAEPSFGTGGWARLFDWSEFEPPTAPTGHGIWLEQPLFKDHCDRGVCPHWRTWEGEPL